VKAMLQLLLLFGMIFWGQELPAQKVTKVGTTASKFLSVPIGSRALALAGAYASVANDATALYWNPGGLAQLENREIFFMHSDWLAGINFDYLALALYGGSKGNFGLSITAMTMGDMEVTTENQPEGTGEFFTASSFAFGLTYSRKITDRFMIGGTTKLIYETIWNSTATGFAIDVGTLFITPFYGVRFGTSISNFGTKMQMSGDNLLVRKDIDPNTKGNNEDVNAVLETDKFDLPLNLKIGISRDFAMGEQNRLTLSMDALYPNDNQQSLNIGAEVAMFDEQIFLRGGVRTLFLNNSEEEFVVGAGLKHRFFGNVQLSLDYAFQSFARLRNVHQYSLLLNF